MTSLATNPLVDRTSKQRAFAVLGGLVALIIALHFVSRFGLEGPGFFNNDGLGDWLSDPVIVVATVARWVALILAYYLFVVTVAVALFGTEWKEGRWSAFAPTSLVGFAGLVLGVSAVAAPMAVQAATADNPPELLRLEQLETLTLREVDTSPSQMTPIDDMADHGHAVAPHPDGIWLVAPGDSFWSIAEEHLSDELTRSDLADSDIVRYWRVLIEANVDRLVDPGNPDLLLPGQELLLPPIAEQG